MPGQTLLMATDLPNPSVLGLIADRLYRANLLFGRLAVAGTHMNTRLLTAYSNDLRTLRRFLNLMEDTANLRFAHGSRVPFFANQVTWSASARASGYTDGSASDPLPSHVTFSLVSAWTGVANGAYPKGRAIRGTAEQILRSGLEGGLSYLGDLYRWGFIPDWQDFREIVELIRSRQPGAGPEEVLVKRLVRGLTPYWTGSDWANAEISPTAISAALTTLPLLAKQSAGVLLSGYPYAARFT